MKKKAYLYIFLLVKFCISCQVTKNSIKSNYLKTVGPYYYYYEGILNRIYNRPEQAIEYLKKSLQFDNSNSAAYYEIALCLSAINNYDESILYLNRAIDLDSTNIYYRNFLGILLLSTGRLDAAMDNQKYLIEKKPENLNYAINYAILLNENNKNDEAIEVLNKIKSENTFIPKVSETLAQIYIAINKLDKAQEEITNLKNFAPDNPLYLIYESNVFFNLGNDSLGFERLNEAIQLSPDLTFPLIELYRKQFEFGLFKESLNTLIKIFNCQVISDLDKVQLFYPILFERYLYNNYPNTIDSLIYSLTEQYKSSIAVSELALEHFYRRADLEQSRFYLNKLLLMDEMNPSRHEKLISFEYSLKNYAKVIELSEIAIKLFPQMQNFYIINALTNNELGNLSQSIVVLKEATKRITDVNDLSDIYGTLGDFYYQNKNENKAFKCYKKSLRYNKNNTRILNNYSYYLSVKGKKLDLALNMSNKAVELEPDNSTYLDTKGWVLYKLKRYSEAKDILKSAVSKDITNSAVIYEHYGDALYMVGNPDGAFIYWIKAKEMGGSGKALEEKIKTGKLFK